MEIKIGEGLFLGGGSAYELSSPIQGLDSPAIRVGDGVYAGRDGGFVSGHFYGHRTITLKGFFVGADCAETSDMRRVLFSYLRIRYALPILITMPGGDQYYTEGYISDVKCDIDNFKVGQYQITLICPDPILYKAENGEVIVHTMSLLSGTNNVGNSGGVEIYPQIIFSNAVDGIEVSNATTEQTMQVDVSTEEGDEVQIDMDKRIITLNGTGINEYRTATSDWWCLGLENNEIVLPEGVGSGMRLDDFQVSSGNRVLTSWESPDMLVESINEHRPFSEPFDNVQLIYTYNSGSPQLELTANSEHSVYGYTNCYGAISADTVSALQGWGFSSASEIVSSWLSNEMPYPTSDFTDTITVDSYWDSAGQGVIIDSYTEGSLLTGLDFNKFTEKSSRGGIDAVTGTTIQEPVVSLVFQYAYNSGSPTGILTLNTQNHSYEIRNGRIGVALTTRLIWIGVYGAAETINNWLSNRVPYPTSDFTDTLSFNSHYSSSSSVTTATIKWKEGYSGV